MTDDYLGTTAGELDHLFGNHVALASDAPDIYMSVLAVNRAYSKIHKAMTGGEEPVDVLDFHRVARKYF